MDRFAHDQGTYAFARFQLNAARRELTRDGVAVVLTPTVFDTLVYLMENRARVVTKEELLGAIWQGRFVEESNLTQTIFVLRKTLREAGDEGRLIVTAPGRGYRFTADVLRIGETVSADAAPVSAEPLLAADEEKVGARWAVDPPGAGVAPRRPPRLRMLAAAALGFTMLSTGGAFWLSRSNVLRPSAPLNSLAVMPFANLSGDRAQDYFSDGLSEELIGALARLRPLHVVGRASSFHFKGSQEDSAMIGEKLGVAYLLEGSVRREGGLVRVSAELSDARTGYERWSATYDRDLKDIFAVQSGIAQAVAEALKVQLFGGDIAALSLNGTTSPEAYDTYLRGRRLLEQGGGEADYREAVIRFDAAIAIDPRYAYAYVGRASALLSLANEFVGPDRIRATYDLALASARQSVNLAPDLAVTQTILAYTLIYAHRDFVGAKQAFARANLLGAGDAVVLLGYGTFTCELGDFGIGIPALRRAVALDPLNPQAYNALGQALIGAHHYPEAIAALQKALALSPHMVIVHREIGDALMLSGDLAGAEAEYSAEPLDWARQTGQAMVRRRRGDGSGARAALAALIANGGGANSYQEAQIYAQWGDHERAFSALDAALQLNDSGLPTLGIDPLFDPLRADLRFAARMAREGLSR